MPCLNPASLLRSPKNKSPPLQRSLRDGGATAKRHILKEPQSIRCYALRLTVSVTRISITRLSITRISVTRMNETDSKYRQQLRHNKVPTLHRNQSEQCPASRRVAIAFQERFRNLLTVWRGYDEESIVPIHRENVAIQSRCEAHRIAKCATLRHDRTDSCRRRTVYRITESR